MAMGSMRRQGSRVPVVTASVVVICTCVWLYLVGRGSQDSAQGNLIRHLHKEEMKYFDPGTCGEVSPPDNSRHYTIKEDLGIYLYSQSDVVSQDVLNGRGFDTAILDEVLRVLREPESQSQTPPVMVDIGANVGWFAVNVAGHGFKVYAFEAMPRNVDLLKASICANVATRKNVQLYPYALGLKEQKCVVISDTKNQGDGHTRCGNRAEDLAGFKAQGYEVRGEMNIRRLDDLLQGDIRVVKIDVEGYEPYVMAGAMRLLTQYRVMYIVTEVSNFKSADDPVRYYHFLLGLGYQCSTTQFNGPDAALETVAKVGEGGLINLFCMKTWFPMED